jgi:peptidoglycan/xylan/chitin deacetylase (PgdA/CDA1 family)
VPAIFFVVGERVKEAPNLVVRAATEGHAIGTHTQTQSHLSELTISDAEAEIRKGIITTSSALGFHESLAPFFRAPCLDVSPAVEAYLSGQALMLWSVDVDSEDWRGDSPDQIIARVFQEMSDLIKLLKLPIDSRARRQAAARAEWFAVARSPLDTDGVLAP